MSRCEFLEILAAASVSGMALNHRYALAAQSDAGFNDALRFRKVSLLHFTDCHAQLLPSYYNLH
jgi:S-sulfosulfanyl-L-cysteine sulfohydrolase